MNNPVKKVKMQHCQALLRTQRRLLNVGINALEDCLEKEHLDKELLFSLCDFVSNTKKTIEFFEGLIKDVEGEAVEVSYAQAIVAKTYMLACKSLKRHFTYTHNISLSLH